MLLFLLGMAILVIGYFTYGRFVEKILGPDDRPTPCRTCSDGVDFVRLPHWKNMLIQLLNIAGVGPVIGVILGIKFGAIAFLIIPVGQHHRRRRARLRRRHDVAAAQRRQPAGTDPA